jgi:hypothetical protein
MTKIQMTKNMDPSAPNRMQSGFGTLENSYFGFVSYFDFRASDLLLIYLDDWENADINKQHYM